MGHSVSFLKLFNVLPLTTLVRRETIHGMNPANHSQSHVHTAVLVVSEGVDLESQIPVGYACTICGQQLVSLVPRPAPQYLIAGSPLAA